MKFLYQVKWFSRRQILFGVILFGLISVANAFGATYSVTTTADFGAGSLRQAVADANATTAADTINFNISSGDPNCNAGGICTITLTGGVIAVQAAGGALTVTNQSGASKLLISGNNASRVFEVGQNGNLTLDNLTVTRCAGVNMGVIINSQGTLTITNSIITQNTGGFIVYSGAFGNAGTLNINNTTVSSNTGIGIFATNQLAGGGTVNIVNSTVSNNIVSESVSGGNGGGIYFLGGQLRITNSTVSGNKNTLGGGIFASTFGTSGNPSMVLTNCTITANTATEGGGGIEVFRGALNLRNTIVAGNTLAGSASDIRFNEAGGVSFGNNLIGTSTNFSTGNAQWLASDILNQNAPRLAPLADNGGFTPTHALLPDSPAINAGNNCVLTANGCGDNNPAVPVDQRGQARFGTVDIGAYELQTACTYEVSPTSVSIPASGGTTAVNVTTQAGCSWTASAGSSGTTVSPTSGTGNGSVSITVPANTGPQRATTITVAGQTVTINQDGGCSFTVSPNFITLPPAGGSTTITVTASNQQCAWSASSGSSIATVTPASGTGNGTVTITLSQNSGPGRYAFITIAGQLVTLGQEQGCAFTISPTSATFSAQGGSGTINVTASDAACTWSSLSNASWIATFSNGNNTGNGTVQYSVAANNGPARTGTITVAGQTFTVNQNSGCAFTLSQSAMTFAGSGGAGAIFVNKSNSQCLFTAVSNADWISVTNTAQGTNIGSVSFSIARNNGAIRVGTIIIGGQTLTITQQSGGDIAARSVFDFDGDGKADVSVFRPSNGAWYLLNSSAGFTTTQFGQAGDRIVPADYDGDGKADIAVFRSGVWYIQRSNLGFTSVQFGLSTDVPVPGDYDNDGKADVAVFRASTGTWYLQRSMLGFTGVQFGQSGDKPIAEDFDGDRKADLAVYRPSTGTWYIQKSQAGFAAVQFGISTDLPVSGDFDADGITDIAVFRPSNGTWYLLRSTAGFTGIQFGQNGDLPTAADYDGDGRDDIAVFRNGVWYLQRSLQGFGAVQFGTANDLPVPAAMIP